MGRSSSPGNASHTPWPGHSARGTLVLPLEASWLGGLPPLLDLDGLVLGRKSEAHLTVLDRAAAAMVREACPEDRIRALFQAQSWSVTATGERWLVRQPLASGRLAHSVVAIVQAPGLLAFREALRTQCGVGLPEPLPHVTLYVAGKPTGIGIPDAAAFERLRVRRLDAAGGPQSS